MPLLINRHSGYLNDRVIIDTLRDTSIKIDGKGV